MASSYEVSGDFPVSSLREEASGDMLVAGTVHNPEYLLRSSAVGERVNVGGEHVALRPILRPERWRHDQAFILYSAHTQSVPQLRNPHRELRHSVVVRMHSLRRPLVQILPDHRVLPCLHPQQPC